MFKRTIADQAQSRFLYIRVFVLIGFGLAYAFIIPPFEAPDEPMHFLRAYGIAEGQFILEDHPRKLVLFFKQVIEARHEHAIIEDVNQLLDQYGNRIPSIAFNTAQYSPIPYIFHAAVIKLVMLFDNSNSSPLLMLYICRIMSLFLFTFLLFLSFLLFPYVSWPVFWIAITPMALSQASIVNVDYIVFCSSIILLSASLGNLRYRTYSLCLIPSAFFLIITKPPYLPLLLVPAISFFYIKSDKKLYRLTSLLSAVIIALIGVFIWSYLVKSLGIYDAMLDAIRRYIGPGINPPDQLGFVVQFPAQFCKVIFRTLSVDGISLYHQLVGVLGWLDTPIPLWVAVGWGIFSFVPILIADTPQHIRYNSSLLLGITCIVAAILTFLSVLIDIYMVWMPVGSATVNLQVRYFHPVIAAFFTGAVLMKPFNIDYEYKLLGAWSLLVMSAVINVVSVLTLVQKYWS